MAVKPVSVTQLNGYVKRVIQTDPLLGNVSVIGEISNIKYHESGHVYFSMKDENSRINCFLPSDRAGDIRYELENGMEITACGYVYIYEKGGTYSFNIRDVEVSGRGNLSIAFESLKEKLLKEGLFDAAHKKSIPAFPRKIALVTSGSGAAVEDMVKIITSKNNIVDIVIFPVQVQGKGAAREISGAIDRINSEFPDMDIIIAGRGGGSMEELWAFNEESVVRSIFKSRIPVISAVGHEIDVTMADFVSDMRAETPTAAAQLAVPDISELKSHLNYMKERLCDLARRHVEKKRQSAGALKIKLESLSPSGIMSLGYGAILDKNGVLTGAASAFERGDALTVVFADGRIDCDVKEVKGGWDGRK